MFKLTFGSLIGAILATPFAFIIGWYVEYYFLKKILAKTSHQSLIDWRIKLGIPLINLIIFYLFSNLYAFVFILPLLSGLIYTIIIELVGYWLIFYPRFKDVKQISLICLKANLFSYLAIIILYFIFIATIGLNSTCSSGFGPCGRIFY